MEQFKALSKHEIRNGIHTGNNKCGTFCNNLCGSETWPRLGIFCDGKKCRNILSVGLIQLHRISQKLVDKFDEHISGVNRLWKKPWITISVSLYQSMGSFGRLTLVHSGEFNPGSLQHYADANVWSLDRVDNITIVWFSYEIILFGTKNNVGHNIESEVVACDYLHVSVTQGYIRNSITYTTSTCYVQATTSRN